MVKTYQCICWGDQPCLVVQKLFIALRLHDGRVSRKKARIIFIDRPCSSNTANDTAPQITSEQQIKRCETPLLRAFCVEKNLLTQRAQRVGVSQRYSKKVFQVIFQ